MTPERVTLARRLTDIPRARQAVQVCLDAFEIATVDRGALERARQLGGSDFEDDLQVACAEIAVLDAIVTRDTDSFTHSTVAVWSPAECRQRLEREA